jgi:hypothetical protein
MRLRLTKTDLLDLARLYRGDAANSRRQAEAQSHTTQAHRFIEQAERSTARARKLEDMAAKSELFVLMATRPFDGGPPSLMIVGGSNASDGSAFASKRRQA